jgi:hypothetical protein
MKCLNLDIFSYGCVFYGNNKKTLGFFWIINNISRFEKVLYKYQ